MKTIIAFMMLLSSLGYAAESMDDLKAAVVQSKGEGKAFNLMMEINRQYYEQNDMTGALQYFSEVEKGFKGKGLEAQAICLSIPILLVKGKYEEAKAKCLYVKETFKGSSWAAEALYQLGELYRNIYGDKAASDKYFQELIKDCPKSSFVGNAKLYLEEQ